MEWKNLYRGFLIGLVDLIPGVSGGTVALILGIYNRLLEAINGFFTKEWKRHLLFLLPLALSVAVAILVFSGLMQWLLETHPKPTFFFFLGLIIGIIPMLLKRIDYKQRFAGRHYFLLAISSIAMGSLVFLREGDATAIMTELTLIHYLFLFLCGIIGSCAMLLPGISGSFVLLILGVYPTVIDAVASFDLKIISVVALGVIIGLLLASRVISYLLKRFEVGTYAVIVGMVLGSITLIFPGTPSEWLIFLICGITFAGGVICSTILNRYDEKL